MSDSLRDRILLALIYSTPNEYLPPPNAMSTQVDAVIAVVSDEYINSRGMFHELDRCLGCEECYVTEWEQP